MDTASQRWINPLRQSLELDSNKRILLAESILLATAGLMLGNDIGFQAAIYLALAVLALGLQGVVPAWVPAEIKPFTFWTLVGLLVAATALFFISMSGHERFIKGVAPTTPQSVGEIQTPPPPVAGPPLASGIDGSWDKTTPRSVSFLMSDGRTCGAEGDGEDTLTNVRKNRVDVPTTYHTVQWADIARVYFPRDKPMSKSLTRWPADEIGKIMRFEDIPVSAEGYIERIRPQAGNKESTNCNATKAADTDWHIAFVEKSGDPEESSIVVEITPRSRVKHPAWTQKNLRPWINSGLPVRFSGWLLFDPEHKNHLGRFRQTLWEIHPITRIEIQSKNGAWIDLDRVGAALLRRKRQEGSELASKQSESKLKPRHKGAEAPVSR